MKKFFSLFKATTKGDLNVFKIKGNKNKVSSFLLFGSLSIMMMFISFTYASLLGDPLHKIGLTYILLTLFSLAIVLINIMETVYKSQGIIFDAKDNNLLFSLPIHKSRILTVRLLKLILFDYIFEVLFLIPCFIKYIIFEMPGLSFYLLSILFLILLPLLPMVIGCIIGYLIKAFSSAFHNKKLIQTVVSLILFFAIYALSFNLQKFVNGLAAQAQSINDLISKIYLPIGLYINLIQKFDILNLICFILISVVPFILFIYIFQFKYDSIINNSKESSSHNKNKKVVVKSTSVLKSLTKKELKTYFSIPAYVINTIIGPLLAVAGAVFFVIKYDSVVSALTGEDFGYSIEQITSIAPLGIIVFIMALSAMTNITCSSISLEGKKLNLIKSLPIDTNKLFTSKIITSDILIVPFMIISSIILIIKLQIFNYNIIFILLTSILFPHIIGQIGLLANLKFPKLDYNSETEVVKQSIAVLASIMIGLILSFATIFSFYYVSSMIGQLLSLSLYSIIFIVITLLLDRVLKTYGVTKYNQL